MPIHTSSATSDDKATAHLDSWSFGIDTGGELSELFAENIVAEVLGVAAKHAKSQILQNIIHIGVKRTDKRDIGFIIMTTLRLDWELNRNHRTLDDIAEAEGSLASRFIASAGAIRSWDLLKIKDIEIYDMENSVIVIIDGLCTHLNCLKQIAGPNLYRTTTVQPNYSTCHVGVLDPISGDLKQRLTAQGYADESTWAGGQGWGIYGYAQTYAWTQDDRFFLASCGLAEYFLYESNLTQTSLGIQYNNSSSG
ncbi:Six-hairpin glycosidase-like protein [Xylaria longipes]|nr:Six-hairpin glycosidase-like protein [Xylaria longipes]